MKSFIPSSTAGEYVPYIELGSGAQYRAYDMHDGRVLKIPLTETETYLVARSRRNTTGNGNQQVKLSERVHTFINGKARIPAMITHGFEDSSDFLQLLGNPKLAGDLLPEDTPTKRWGAGRVVYSQDKLLMTHEVLRSMADKAMDSHTLQRLRQMIDAYIKSTHQLWQYGYADYVFKFGDTGFDANGRLVFVDIGECSSDLDFMLKVASQQRWRNNLNLEKDDFPQLPSEIHEYFIAQLTEAFSPEVLKKLWRQKHICSDCSPQDDIVSAFVTAKVSEIDYIDRW